MIAAPLGGAWKRESPIHSLSRRLPLKEKVQFSLSLFLARSAEEEGTEDGEDALEKSSPLTSRTIFQLEKSSPVTSRTKKIFAFPKVVWH